ncbi:MAG TPA: cobalamin-binding protein [Clostridia bacterium]|nr:cobalamin-binding protein [Clostridia bacterium]
MMDFEKLSSAVIAGNEVKVRELVQSYLEESIDPLEIINQGLVGGMGVVGARFKNGEMFVPEVLMSARAMNGGLDLVKPLIADTDLPSVGKVVLGTVKGDLHDIGKNLVGMMMESAGLTVFNLGVDVSPEKFVAVAREQQANIVAMSALLTTTMLHMKDTIEILKEEGFRDQVKVIVGGAPVSNDFAEEIGADGYAPDAASATDLCKNLLKI